MGSVHWLKNLGRAITGTTVGSKQAMDVYVTGGTLGSESGVSVVDKARYDYIVPVTTADYTEIVALTADDASAVEIFDSSGQTMVLAFGGAGAEVDKIYIFPGGNGRIPLTVPAGTRLSVKAVSATATAGELTVNLYG